ncbi:cytosolic sulfotransferase 8-like [Eucalyptus grandis]|uniref:cytosolic sulfotransferase 8-like n=1 Tax=Eucalyptus grandis TaxID=71139 RepID=UPI00192EC072|nr:cytosolic sulfotransferase 8-like [Eucalyptus grandis]
MEREGGYSHGSKDRARDFLVTVVVEGCLGWCSCEGYERFPLIALKTPNDPCVHARRLADFVGCPFSEEELRGGIVEGILRMCSFDNLSTLEVNKSGSLWTGAENKSFFRRGEVGDWVNYMSAEMGERIDGVMEEKLHGSGLKF